MPPGQTLVYWAEHVIRTGGAHHLRSPVLDVMWYQKLYLDLGALVFGGLALIIVLIKRLLCGRTKSSKNTKSKKNN